MKTSYNIDISKNYDDSGTMLYDLEKEKNVQGVIIVKNAVTKSPYFREKV